MTVLITAVIIITVVVTIVAVIFLRSRKSFREQKSYERSLKMVPLLIHLPPPSDDIDTGARDQRDVLDEVISQAQTMYNVISSTATRGFKSSFYGQRHISFELVAHNGLIRYYIVVPMVLLETIRQAVMAAYPTARLEEVEEINLFSQVGKISGTIGGEFNLKKEYSFPIATYQESKRDAMRALLSALSTATREDGIGVQIMLRPASENWIKIIERRIRNIREGRRGAAKGRTSIFGGGGSSLDYFSQLIEVLWKPPHSSDTPKDTSGASTEKSLSGTDQAQVEAMEEKIKHAGYEVLIRVVASSNTAARSQTLLGNVISSFSMFDSPAKNGFTFTPTRDIESFVTSYIFRFFPAEIRSNILNTVELATIFHLPDQNNIPSSQVERQRTKQVDGPTEMMDQGFLLGYNVFRGVKKPIRLSDKDRRRHVYIIGQTGTGKSWLHTNLALQDMLDGKGFATVDPHGDLAEDLLGMVPKERVEDVIYFSPSDMDNPIGLNILEAETRDEQDFVISEMISMLYSLYDPGHTGIVGPRMENIVRYAALLLMSDPKNPATFMDIPKCLVDPEFAKSKLPYVTDQQTLDFWTKEWPNAQRSNDAGEVTAWVVSKWAPFQTGAIRNVIGQSKSGLDIREIMDNKKILLVNLSKGKLGEKNAQLLGMMFVMKFQQAAMSRANIPEEERVDFTLYVDEFQNFATDSFESILSEARKYRLSLIVANQFMTQLTEKIREAVIGNVGTAICGRIGVTDAELMVKRFQPTFDLEDLIKMPNFTSVSQVLINSVPSAPFSMDWIPLMGHPNPQLADALKRLSAAKYGRPRAIVEAEITQRLQAADIAREEDKRKRLEAMRNSSIPVPGKTQPVAGGQNAPSGPTPAPSSGSGGGTSFLDDWLAKRQRAKPSPSSPAATPPSSSTPAPTKKEPTAEPQPLEISSPPPTTPQPAVAEPGTTSLPPVASLTIAAEPPPPAPAMSESEIEAEITKELRIARSQAISEMSEKKIIQEDIDAANANGELKLSSDEAGEIFIDVRGNIHQGDD
ncbi:MAG: TraM recognition domain-containing protein [Candidatus Nomurabacteria bacterium]|nr:TraM recognition domain-containing protein [Candidatus Nomurabacteria bacterium]